MLNMNKPVKKVADLSIRCNILMRQKNQEENKREMCTYFFFWCHASISKAWESKILSSFLI